MGMYQGNLCHQWGRCCCPANAPTGHVVDFANSLNRDCSIKHTRKRCEARVFAAVIDKMLIGFIHKHINVGTDGNFSNSCEVFSGMTMASGIVRVAQKQKPGFWCHVAFQIFNGKPKAILRFHWYGYRYAASQTNERLEPNIGRVFD